MLIVALVLAVVGLAALVTAVVTSNELIAWVCIAASVIGVLLLIVDALRDRKRDGDDEAAETTEADAVIYDEDYPEEAPVASDYQDSPAADVSADADVEPVPHDREEDTTVLTPEHEPYDKPGAGDDSTKA
ncbi:DUF308 domain-containing protein [Mycolicibacterium hippocampi]|uniref:Transmembrane protein n=1 Tax=Mycolicibacterium hippocampi TaxID=659824 RepID=A0A7I9ZSQ6_9MYCO|nr:DUF308 domain-containing protein [Mycolicibacterium hippocampi]GFH03813.1 hypothetical protein MHIP_42960 [Mycolicibacterium hippocampi]